MLHRRSFLALTAGGLLVPRRLLAAPNPSERKFLFIFCQGGWDTTKCLTPVFDNPNVDTDEDATTTTFHGIPIADSPQRPAVASFFEAYGDRCCVLNGMEVRSITHERCLRIALTGSSETGRDDWGATLAGLSTNALLAPYVVVTGTAFTDLYTSKVVRVGTSGQLPDLLDGTSLTMTEQTFTPPTAATQDAVDAFVRARATEFTAAAGAGRARAFGQGYGTALDQVRELDALSGTLNLASTGNSATRDLAADASIAFSCFENGISRVAMLRAMGIFDQGWDTHTANSAQDQHYEVTFAFLKQILEDLDSRTGPDGLPLADQVTIVVMSEMGRTPTINGALGRDHWTYTSALLIGGVNGGRVIGEMDEGFLGRPVDLVSGEATDSGTRLLPGHLGATLMAMADIDPVDAGVLDPPIEAVYA